MIMNQILLVIKLVLYPQSDRFDPDRFDPDRFEPDRFEPECFNPEQPADNKASFDQLPVGGRLREWIGTEFVRLEKLIFVSKLLRDYRWEVIAKPKIGTSYCSNSSTSRWFAR